MATQSYDIAWRILDERACQAVVMGSQRSWTQLVTKHTSGQVAKTLSSNAGGWGSILVPGTRSHKSQLRIHMLRLKIPCCT